MKKALLFSILLAFLIGWNACSGWDNDIDIDFNDPQDIEWVENIIDEDLLLILDDLKAKNGIDYIHFGHTPPNLDSISFIVNKLWYDTCIKYFPDGHASYKNPGFENAYYEHHFPEQVDNIAHHRLHSFDSTYFESRTIDCENAYIIGSGNNFTVYFKHQFISETQGNPTYAYLVSGTLVYDSIPNSNDSIFVGIKNYRIAKKIVATEPDPAPYYCKGTLMVLKPLRENQNMPYWIWDTIPNKN